MADDIRALHDEKGRELESADARLNAFSKASAALEAELDSERRRAAGRVEELEEKLLSWERDVEAYESLTGKQLDEDLKVAIVMGYAPAAVQHNVQLNAATLV